jgi:hypothetical protein
MRYDHEDQHLPIHEKKIKSMRGYFFLLALSRKIILPKEYEPGDHHRPTKEKKKRRC